MTEGNPHQIAATNPVLGGVLPPLRVAARDWKGNRSAIIALAAGLAGAGLVYLVNKSELHLGGLAPIGMAAGLFLIVQAIRDWEFGLKSVLVIVVLEGAVRKWLLPSFSEVVYFYKDVLIVVTLLAYLGKRNHFPLMIKKYLSPLSLALMAFVTYSLIVTFNPSGSHILISLLGLKAYCLYIPLIFMTARMFSDRDKLVAFLKWYSVMVLPVAAICMMQFMDSSPTASLNRYAWQDPSGGEGNVAGFVDSTGTNYIRVTGTFSYISGLSVYLPVIFASLLALISLKSTRQMPTVLRWLLYICIGGATVAAFMTGSRGAVFPIALTMVFFYLFSPIKHVFKRFREVAVIGIVVYVCFSQAFPQAYDAFTTRAFGSSEEVNEGMERILISFTLPADEARQAGALGYGIGITQNAVSAISRMLGIENPAERLPLNPEAEPGRIMMETGLMGFGLYLLVRILLFATLLRVCLLIRDPESKAMAVAIFGVLILQLIMGGAIINHTQGVYQWALAGIPLGLLNAERLAAHTARSPIPPVEPYRNSSTLIGMPLV